MFLTLNIKIMPLQFSIPKVNAGQVNQRGKHNLSHNVATSFDFGRVQPVFCKLVTPDSHIKGSNLVHICNLPPYTHAQYYFQI